MFDQFPIAYNQSIFKRGNVFTIQAKLFCIYFKRLVHLFVEHRVGEFQKIYFKANFQGNPPFYRFEKPITSISSIGKIAEDDSNEKIPETNEAFA